MCNNNVARTWENVSVRSDDPHPSLTEISRKFIVVLERIVGVSPVNAALKPTGLGENPVKCTPSEGLGLSTLMFSNSSVNDLMV